MEVYPGKIESQRVLFFQSLSEKDRLRYAPVEAAKLGHGGTAYNSRLFDQQVN